MDMGQDPKGNDIVWKKMLKDDELFITEKYITLSKPNAMLYTIKKVKK